MKNIVIITVVNLIYYTFMLALLPMPTLIFVILFLIGYGIGLHFAFEDDGRYIVPYWEVITAGFIWMLGPGVPIALDYYLLGGYLQRTLWSFY